MEVASYHEKIKRNMYLYLMRSKIQIDQFIKAISNC